MIKLAKLSEKQLTEVTQVLYYGENENNPDLKLLELNNTLLSAIQEGQVLAFKGTVKWCIFGPIGLFILE